MIPWESLGSAAIPNSAGTLQLYKRDEEYSIRVNNCELMNSRAHGSEEALAELSCKRVADREKPQILIGGLGMGFTAAAALQHLPESAEIVVAELVPGLVEWNRHVFGHLAGAPLKDQRIKVAVGDVAKLLKQSERAFDAIILDVDNGPEGLTQTENDWLYGPSGLRAARRALKPNGILAVWSVAPSSIFSKRLQQANFKVEETRPRAIGKKKGARHCVWLASI